MGMGSPPLGAVIASIHRPAISSHLETTMTTTRIPNHPTDQDGRYLTPLLLTHFPSHQVVGYGGDDGRLYLWANSSWRVLHQYDDCIRAVAVSPSGHRVAIGFDDGSTKVYAYDDWSMASSSSHPFLMDDSDTSSTSFAGPRLCSSIRQLAFSPNGQSLAVVSEDGDCPLVVCRPEDEESTQLGEASAVAHGGGGVRSVAYSRDGCQLASLGMDGILVTWALSGEAWSVCHKDVLAVVSSEAGEGMGSDAGDRASRLAWGCVANQSVLLLPGKIDVQFRCGGEADNMKKQLFVTETRHVDVVVTMAWHPTEPTFVTGGRDGKVCLWQMRLEGEKVIGSLVKEILAKDTTTTTQGIPPITSLIWTGHNEILVADASGAVFVADVGAKKEDQPVTETTVEESSGQSRLGKPTMEPNDDDDDAMFEEDAVPAVTAATKASNFIDDEAEDDDVTVDLPSSNPETTYEDFTQPESSHNAQDVDADEDIVPTHDDDDSMEPNDDNVPPTTTMAFPPLQPAFAPSSTPINEPRRILCWNHIGVVTSYPDPDSTYNLVDVSFHETAGLVGGRRPINFTDNLGFIVGTLGDEGALFASDLIEDEDDDDFDDGEFDDLGVMSEAARKAAKASRRKKKREDGGKGSQVYFNRFETFGRNADKDWVVALPDGERVMGCATGKGWCGVITSRRYLRLFTSAGIQGPMIWLSGEPVTIVGRDRFVGVFYHRSTTPMQDGTQLLGYTIFDGIKGTTIASGEVSAMSPGASLTWAGFTEACALSVMDSEGMLSMLARQATTDGGNSSGNWIPMLDTVGHKKSTHDTYWPVEVHGGKLVCVLLRGGKEHPDAARRPVTTTLSLRMPLAAGLTKSGQVEELSVRGKIAVEQKKILNDYNVSLGEANMNDAEDEYLQLSAQIDKITLKLFNETIKTSKVERALSLVDRLHLEKSFDIAIQISDRMGHRKLSDLIDEVKIQRFPPVDEDFFDDNNSLGSRERSDNYDEAMTLERQERGIRGISPEIGTPKARTPRDDASESTHDESPPNASLKRKFEDNAAVSTKRRNPFAKKTMASPAKGIMKTPPSPAKLTLSRQSTFSTTSRQKQRKGKQIM